MEDVAFQEESQYKIRPQGIAKKKGLPGLVMKMGLAPDEKSAELVLIIVAVLAAVVALGVFIFGGVRGNPPERPAVPNPANLTL